MGMMDALAGLSQGSAKGIERQRTRDLRQQGLDQQASRDAMTQQLQQLQMDAAAQGQRRRDASAQLAANPELMGTIGQQGPFQPGMGLTDMPSAEAIYKARDYRTPGELRQDALDLYGDKKKLDQQFSDPPKVNYKTGTIEIKGVPTEVQWNPEDPQGTMQVIGTSKGAPTGSPDVKLERDLRKEYSGEAEYFKKIKNSYETIKSIGREDSPAGDIGLVFSIMKMFDPGSVVRESEFATAQNAAGVPDRVKNAYNQALEGVRLSPKQRLDFIGTADRIYGDQANRFQQKRKFYSDLATSYGMAPERIVYDFSADAKRKEGAAPKKQAGADFVYNPNTGGFE